ncbi:hypothetical protein D3C78_1051260 [compost metagenome]
MQIGDGLVEMECLDDNLHFATEGCLVYVFLAPEQVWLDIAVLAGQVAIEIGRDGGTHHLDRPIAWKGVGQNVHALIVETECP